MYYYLLVFEVQLTFCILFTRTLLQIMFHIESESCIFVMYRFNAEHPGQFLYTPTTVGVILQRSSVRTCTCTSCTCTCNTYMYTYMHKLIDIKMYSVRVYLYNKKHTCFCAHNQQQNAKELVHLP